MTNLLVQNNFSKAARSYQAHAKVQYEIGQRLLERFDYYTLEPKHILDLGAGPGLFSHALKKRFPKSLVTALDCSSLMLKKIKRKWLTKINKVAADMSCLPFKNDSFDIIFANQSIHWANDYQLLFKDISRILKPGGVFVFSTLGPDTFKEIKLSWHDVDHYSHVKDFSDMHLLGDVLLKSNFSEPVVDMEYITVRYKNVKSMAEDLKAQGVQHHGEQANKGLMSPRRWHQYTKNYESLRDQDSLLPLTYEVVYGQAWGQQLKQSIGTNGEVIVPIRSMFKR